MTPKRNLDFLKRTIHMTRASRRSGSHTVDWLFASEATPWICSRGCAGPLEVDAARIENAMWRSWKADGSGDHSGDHSAKTEKLERVRGSIGDSIDFSQIRYPQARGMAKREVDK